MKTLAVVPLLAALAAPCLAAQRPHEHGVVHLDVAVEARRITLMLDSPLDNLVGFERAPRNDAEHLQVDAALARLREADTLFVISPAAQCKLVKVDLESAALKLGTPPEPDAGGHADIGAGITFDCADARRAGAIDVALFGAYPRIQRIEVQAVTPKGQFKATLKRPAGRLPLVR